MTVRVRRHRRGGRVRDARHDVINIQVDERSMDVSRDEARRIRNQLGRFKLDIVGYVAKKLGKLLGS